MQVTKIPADVLFRVYTSCAGDPQTLILDVRPIKQFAKAHLAGAYCIRLAANGKTLLDYSKNTYHLAWSDACWWDKHVVVYGEPRLKRDHPVVAFLAADKHAKSLNIFADGLEEFEKQYPFLVTASIKANAGRRFPGEILPGLLYLGDWDHASDWDSLDALRIKRIVTVHNNPENLRPPPRFKRLRFVLADVETEDVSRFFNESFEFIEAARAAKEAVLVHCGAGVSRSAALCVAYLMRRYSWPAARARAHCVQRRSLVCPNDGFWRSLCALEAQLGIQQRSDPTAVSGFRGADAPAKLAEGAAGEKVDVAFVPAHKLRAAAEAAAAAEEAAQQASGRKRSRSRSPERRRGRRGGSRERGERRRTRSRSRGRRREGGAERGGAAAAAGAEAEAEAEAPVVLESSKEKKVLGQLRVWLRGPAQRCVFGRLPSCEVVLEHLSISRQHAQLGLDAAGDLFITDLGSSHRTNVDGVWIRPDAARPLPVGATFRLGGSSREFKVLMTPRERARQAAQRQREEQLREAAAAAAVEQQ